MDISSARGKPYSNGFGMKTMFQMTIPVDDMPPPFQDNRANKNYDLLQNTAYCRDGKQRVPTPERLAVLELAESLEKHKLRRQQQLLLDIAQRCKEQDIWNMSSGLSRPCSLSSFDNKYIKDMKLYSTNTILFKTWENATDGALMLPHPVEERRELDSGSPRLNERSNTHFPRRRVIKHAPKPLGLKPLPQLQLGYSKGLMVRAPDADKKQILIEERRINGPIQLGIYQSKSDELKPLILPSIRYIGIDKDDVQTYVSSKQMNLTLGPRGKSMHGTFAPLTAPDKKDAKEPRPSPELKMIGNAPGKSSIVETARTAPTGPDPTPRVEFDFKPDNNTEADSIINPVNIPSGYSHT